MILEIVTGVERPCSNIDPLGLDTVTDCLTCSNSDYKILQEDKVIKDYKKSSSKEKKENQERYIVEFFDGIPKTDNLMTYLENDNSNYRITRESDGIILRPSLEDRKKEEEEEAKMMQKFEETKRKFYSSYQQDSIDHFTKKKTLFNHLFNMRKKENKSS